MKVINEMKSEEKGAHAKEFKDEMKHECEAWNRKLTQELFLTCRDSVQKPFYIVKIDARSLDHWKLLIYINIKSVLKKWLKFN